MVQSSPAADTDTGTTLNYLRYGGAWGYFTEPSGLQQLGYRFYWPELGRFVQQDPIGDGMNSYAYVRNSPVASADPTGLWWPWDRVVSAAHAAVRP